MATASMQKPRRFLAKKLSTIQVSVVLYLVSVYLHSQGITGTGQCSCFSPWVGSACQYSRNATCNAHGNPSASGACTCDTGFAAPNWYIRTASWLCVDVGS